MYPESRFCQNLLVNKFATERKFLTQQLHFGGFVVAGD